MAVERVSATDRAFLAMDCGAIPEQIGVVLRFGPGSPGPTLGQPLSPPLGQPLSPPLSPPLSLERVQELVGNRVRAVPRLRQRLVRTPVGCGGPIWVDDAGFDVRRHVGERVCRAPGDDQALLDTATAVVMTRLERSAPLWSVTVVTGLDDGGVALVVVLHHVLADGAGGLAVLSALTDDSGASGVGTAPDTRFPRPAPTAGELARDAWSSRARAVGRLPDSWRLLRRTMSAGGGLRPVKAAGCSLNRRTGPRRAVTVVTADRARLTEAAHRAGATTNDAVLVAVAAALEDVLRLRGESVDPLVVTVPVSGRTAPSDAAQLGNLASPLLVDVPTSGPVGERLARVGATIRAGRSAAVGPPPIASLGWLFRPLARAGGFRLYMNHQHRFHTLISHLRGPDRAVTFGGHAVRAAIPLAVSDGGNQTVYFEVLSYAGALAVTTVADPDSFAELGRFAELLRGHLERIVEDASGEGPGLSDRL